MGISDKLEIRNGKLTYIFGDGGNKLIAEGRYEKGQVFIEKVNIEGAIPLAVLSATLGTLETILPQEELPETATYMVISSTDNDGDAF